MQLLDHVSIAVDDLARARPFYDAVMAALGAVKVWEDGHGIGYGERSAAGDDRHSYLTIRADGAMGAPSARRHWCFRASDRRRVEQFHAAGLAHGGCDAGPPSLRPEYHADYYAAFLFDPAGNKIEAVCHHAETP